MAVTSYICTCTGCSTVKQVDRVQTGRPDPARVVPPGWTEAIVEGQIVLYCPECSS